MSDNTKLIRAPLLQSEGFLREVHTLLALDTNALRKIGELSATPEGLAQLQASILARDASIPPTEARSALRVAEYLYERVREARIPLPEALIEIDELALTLGIDISDKRPLISEILRAKNEYESGRNAQLKATEVVPHIQSFEGVWDIRPVFNRETGKIVSRVKVLLLTVGWHDSTRSHSATFQLREDDWAEILRDIEELERRREELASEMDTH